MVRTLPAQKPKTLPHHPPALALPSMDARPKLPLHANAPAVVANKEATIVCNYCGVPYGLGPAQGELFISYPKAEHRYWQHCLTTIHQEALERSWATTKHHLTHLTEALTKARIIQRETHDPTRKALKTLLT